MAEAAWVPKVGQRVRVRDGATTHAGQRGIVVECATWSHPFPSVPPPTPTEPGVIVLIHSDQHPRVYFWRHELAAVDDEEPGPIEPRRTGR